MEQRQFILLFITAIVPLVLSGPRRYYLVQQLKTWSDAQVYCRTQHTDLAVIENADDLRRFQNEIQRQQFTSSAWIGLYNDVTSWRWSYGDVPLGSLRPWNPGEPSNSGGVEQCGMITGNCWCDVSCKTLFGFVCFDATKTGSQMYIYISTATAWYDAQIYCRTHYTDLASLSTSAENSAVGSIAPSQNVWMGLFRDSWKWIDQTNLSTTHMIPIITDNAKGNENCGYFSNGQAFDAQCTDLNPFFCYSPITNVKQIIKLKVQSSQDANDPTVKAAILDQINQKLKDHGMEQNITVTWREQPEGTVFYNERDKVEL